EIACVLTEPALTNVGVILPDPGFHDAVRTLTREHGTLLIVDETHTLITGPGGLVRSWGLAPDVVTVGKSIGGGIPIGAYGMSAEVAEVLERPRSYEGGELFADEIATGGGPAGGAPRRGA